MEKNRDLSNEPMHVRPMSLQQRSQDSALGRGESLQQTVLGKPDSHVQKNGTDRSLTLRTKISSKTLPWKPSGFARFLPPPRGEKQVVGARCGPLSALCHGQLPAQLEPRVPPRPGAARRHRPCPVTPRAVWSRAQVTMAGDLGTAEPAALKDSRFLHANWARGDAYHLSVFRGPRRSVSLHQWQFILWT